MKIPSLSVLQILILDTMGIQEIQSVELRKRLKEAGFRKSAPAFYQAMTRLEDSNMIDSRYTTRVLHGHTVKEKHFRVTGDGVRALAEARLFFDRLSWEALGHG